MKSYQCTIELDVAQEKRYHRFVLVSDKDCLTIHRSLRRHAHYFCRGHVSALQTEEVS